MQICISINMRLDVDMHVYYLHKYMIYLSYQLL